MERHDIQPGTDDYYDFKSDKVSSTDIGVILGLIPSGWKSVVDLWAEKTGRKENKEITNPNRSEDFSERAWFGSNVEDVILDRYQEENEEKDVQPVNQLWQHGEDEWMVSSPDGEADDRVLELKFSIDNPFHHNADFDWGHEEDDAPIKYLAQVMWTMGVSGYDRADIAAYLFINNELKFKTYTIEKDDELIDNMKEQAQEFLHYVREDKTPEIDTSEEKEKLHEYLYSDVQEGRMVESDKADEIMEKIKKKKEERRERKKELIEPIEDEIDELEQQLEEIIGEEGAEGVKGEKYRDKWSKYERWYPRKGKLEKVKENHPELFEEVFYKRSWRKHNIAKL